MKKGMIPFTIKDVKFGDRIVHMFERYEYDICVAYLGKVYCMELDEIAPENDALFGIYTDKLGYKVQPFIGGWNIYIDRRNPRQRFIQLFM